MIKLYSLFLQYILLLSTNILKVTSQTVQFMLKGARSEFRSKRLKSVLKSKHIKKAVEEKLAYFFKEDRQREDDLLIYVDSQEEEVNNKLTFQCLKPQPQSFLVPRKEAGRQVSSDSSWSEEMQQGPPSVCSYNLPSFQLGDPIFKASSFKQIQQIDFEIYTTFLARTKIYGGMLIDEYGKLLWCDKVAHQLLEGSLNNFQRMRVQNLLLSSMVNQFLQEMRGITHYDHRTTLKWIVYSKNSKRRYFRVPLPKEPSPDDIFYRFLKSLTLRVRPICICLPRYRDPNGFCNEKLIPIDRPANCFFLELRLTKNCPYLNSNDILLDPTIKKFLRNTQAKLSQSNSYIIRSSPMLDCEQNKLVKEKVQDRQQMDEQGESSETAAKRKGAQRLESKSGKSKSMEAKGGQVDLKIA